MKRSSTLVEDATQFLANATNLITSPVSAIFSTKPQEPASSITVDDVSTGDFDLLEDEIVDAELAPHEELDDSLEPLRYVHVVGIQPGALLSEKIRSSEAVENHTHLERARAHWLQWSLNIVEYAYAWITMHITLTQHTKRCLLVQFAEKRLRFNPLSISEVAFLKILDSFFGDQSAESCFVPPRRRRGSD